MWINIHDVSIKKRTLIESEKVFLEDNKINLIQGKNGVGKTLLLKKYFIFAKPEEKVLLMLTKEMI